MTKEKQSRVGLKQKLSHSAHFPAAPKPFFTAKQGHNGYKSIPFELLLFPSGLSLIKLSALPALSSGHHHWMLRGRLERTNGSRKSSQDTVQPSSSCCLGGFFNPLRFDLLFVYVGLPGTAKWLALSTETRTDTSEAAGRHREREQTRFLICHRRGRTVL